MIALRKGLRPWWVVFGLLLATSAVATAGHEVREKTDKLGFAIPRYERSRIEKPILNRPRIETRVATDVFRQPKARSLTLFPHQTPPLQPYRHVIGWGRDLTSYRIGLHPLLQERSIVHKRFYHGILVPKRGKETAY